MSVNLVNNNRWKILPTLTRLPPKPQVVCKADTGASSNYLTERDEHILQKIETVKNGPMVKLPNNYQIQASKQGLLPLPSVLSNKARTAHVFKGLTNSSLLSIGRLCDDGCIAIFDANDLKIYKKNILIMRGTRNFQDGLWDVSLNPHSPLLITNTQPIQQSINAIVRKDLTKMKLGEYLHKCAFSPCVSTFLKAIRLGYFQTWPGIESINFKNIMMNLAPTAKGHLDQERKNLQSTQQLENDFFPQHEPTKNI